MRTFSLRMAAALAALGLLAGCTAAPASTAEPASEPAAVSQAAEAEPAPAPETPETSAPAADADPMAGYVQDFAEVATLAKPVETDDGRTLTLNCTLDTEVDQLIYDHYRYELLGDLDGALSLVGDSEALRITTENDVRNVQEGAGAQSYTLHGLRALTTDEMARVRAYDRDAIFRIVADYGLTEWTLEAVDVEWTYTEAELAKGPQLDAGRYMRYFLAGRTSADQPWALYELFWEDLLPDAATAAEDPARLVLETLYSCDEAESAAFTEALNAGDEALVDYLAARTGNAMTADGYAAAANNRVPGRILTAWPDTAVTVVELLLTPTASSDSDGTAAFAYTVKAAPQDDIAAAQEFTGEIAMALQDGVWLVTALS